MKKINTFLKQKTGIHILFALYLLVVLRLTVLRPGLLPLHLFQGGVIDLFPLEYYVY